MKKVLLIVLSLSVLLCLVLTSCTSVGTENDSTSSDVTSSDSTTANTTEGTDTSTDNSDPSEPLNNSYLFDSYEELAAFFLPDESGDIPANKYAETHSEQFSAFVNDIITQKAALLLPVYNDAPMPLQNQEGYSIITLFTSELYSRPWIWYHCLLNGQKISIRVMLLSEEEQNIAESGTCSALISHISPDAPNVNNYGSFSSYESIYSTDISLESKDVSAMISELKDSSKKYVAFAFDGVLVNIYADSEVLTEEFLSKLSFAQSYASQLKEGMAYDEVAKVMGSSGTDVGSGAIIYTWKINDEKALYVWFHMDNDNIMRVQSYKVMNPDI